MLANMRGYLFAWNKQDIRSVDGATVSTDATRARRLRSAKNTHAIVQSEEFQMS